MKLPKFVKKEKKVTLLDIVSSRPSKTARRAVTKAINEAHKEQTDTRNKAARLRMLTAR